MAGRVGQRKRIGSSRYQGYEVSGSLSEDEDELYRPPSQRQKADSGHSQPALQEKAPPALSLAKQPRAKKGKALPPSLMVSSSTAEDPSCQQPAMEILKLPEEVLSLVCSHLTPKRLVTVCAVRMLACQSCRADSECDTCACHPASQSRFSI